MPKKEEQWEEIGRSFFWKVVFGLENFGIVKTTISCAYLMKLPRSDFGQLAELFVT